MVNTALAIASGRVAQSPATQKGVAPSGPFFIPCLITQNSAARPRNRVTNARG